MHVKDPNKNKKTFGLTYPIVVGKFKSQVQHDATCICPTKMLYVYENMGKETAANQPFIVQNCVITFSLQ